MLQYLQAANRGIDSFALHREDLPAAEAFADEFIYRAKRQPRALEGTKAVDYAKQAYETYNKAVGGVAFNGDPLPSWDEFAADESKQKQVGAWIAVGELFFDLLLFQQLAQEVKESEPNN